MEEVFDQKEYSDEFEEMLENCSPDNYFEDDNPRFDRGTFIDATYLTKEEMRLPL